MRNKVVVVTGAAHGLGRATALRLAAEGAQLVLGDLDDKAPDYARTVEIHRKPGFDPVELFMDPAISLPPLAIGWRLAKKALGFRTLMDVIPLDATLVKGSHGRLTDRPEEGPLIISSESDLLPEGEVAGTDVKQIVLTHLFD